MADNPFRVAMEPSQDAQDAMERTLQSYPTFAIADGRPLTQAQRIAMNPNMTRQEMFEEGILRVADMDDEELREGRMRGRNGVIPKRGIKTGMIPADLYDEMVAEHMRRTNEKIRSQMDVALGTLVEIMGDDTVEPRDRMDAAKYLFERHAGKTPERVAVSVSKEPWEEVMGGIAQVSRAESKRLREGAIDVETFDLGVEVPEGEEGNAPQDADMGLQQGGVEPRVSGSGAPTPGIQGQGKSAAGEVHSGAPLDVQEVPPVGPKASQASMGDQRAPGESAADLYRPSPVEQLGLNHPELFGDTRIPPATKVPGYRDPEMSSATAPPVDNLGRTNSERLRDEQEAKADLAARRKAAREKLDAAKKDRRRAKSEVDEAKRHRIVKRNMGINANNSPKIGMVDDGERLRFTLD